tara:strand:- start:2033 stop:2254 length:222 start_codon:yes stop_codon:yes gene_type:complete
MLLEIFHYIMNLFRQDPPNKVVMSSPTEPLRMIEDMTKRELDKLGEANGVRLDRRRKKEVLVAKLKEAGIHHG